MPELNWNAFEKLQGDPTKNWELLCRELVRRNYARFGSFRSVRQQPGIEFQLALESDCSLGAASRHFGWQCRWYELRQGQQVGTKRRQAIADAIQKTEKHSPEITDWVLWTRRSLTPEDQKWFYALPTKFKLDLWAEEHVLGLLVGDAVVLKESYFGELVLSYEKLRRMHDEVMAPICKRWEPQLHVEVEVERHLKSMLGSPGTWPAIRESSERMFRRAQQITSEMAGLTDDEKELANSASESLNQLSCHLKCLANAIDEGSIGTVSQELESPVRPKIQKRALARLAARLRSRKLPASLSIASTIWEITNYFELLGKLTGTLEQLFFAVIGDAGFGKTFLSAELTKVTDDSPGGVLLLAKSLGKNGTMDDLARRVAFGGDRMEQLLEAVDAAGARLGRRIPIVIDGLNESENPRDWSDLISTLLVKLKHMSNCVVVVTLRAAVANEILPEGVTKLYLTGFEHDCEKAIRTYFDYYKIDAADALLPWHQLSSPLFLSLFCQATNPDRKVIVGVDRIPRSLTEVFGKYRDVVISRAANTLNIAPQDVKAALERVGLALWNENVRAFDFGALRQLVGDHDLAWANSLARVLEEEGVLTRDPYPRFMRFDLDGHRKGNQVSAILYDAFAGFVIADAILTQQTIMNFPAWISESFQRLDVFKRDHHPFAEDILNGLVGLLPRRHHRQLWKCVPSPLRESALLETTNLEPERIDEETRIELAALCRQTPAIGGRDFFLRLWSTRGSVKHPLNAEFLHDVLLPMNVAHRDLKWTEWIRRKRKEIVEDLENLEELWSGTKDRNERDRLLARWVSWMLTSTVRYLRDQATQTLYWYGLGAPDSFFKMVVDSLDVNDPYVSERMFAAAYGVVMGKQRKPDEIREALADFVERVARRIVGDNATSPTNHWMTRVYFQGVVNFAQRFLQSIMPNGIVDSDGQVIFGRAAYVSADYVMQKHCHYLGHDFENYEVGRLFDDRRNYDYEHKSFKAALTEIRGRIWGLGFRESEFKDIESDISGDYTHRDEPDRTERYAKKYGWIGLYEKAGILAGAGQLSYLPRYGRGNPIVDIDPSFPRVPEQLAINMPDWVDLASDDNKVWLGSGKVTVPNELLRLVKIGDHEGPWVAVDGFLEVTNKVLARETFGFIRGILVPMKVVKRVVKLLQSKDYLGNHFIPEEPSDHYTFAGEIPWGAEFASDDESNEELGPYKERLGGSWGKGPIVEVLSHRYAWENYHSSMNRGGGCSVPSRAFSEEFDLRSAPSRFSQYESNGSLAAISLAPPEGCNRDGNVLYLREDLLLQYANARNVQLVWAIWGERNLINIGYDRPEWSTEIYQRYGHLWRRIVELRDVIATTSASAPPTDGL